MNYYAPNVRLMNDGLDSSGNMTNDPYKGNIRYYGDIPNNYIYFNCSDYDNQSSSTCETWRILGIVDGKVKLVRSDYIAFGYLWDMTSTGEYDNNWNDATINTLLNEAYYNSGTMIYYNSDNGVGETVSFETNGITQATRNNNLISPSSWYVNELSTTEMYANAAYKEERNGEKVWEGNIGLIYPSDYSYLFDFNKYSTLLSSIHDGFETSWFNDIFYYGDYFMLITPVSGFSTHVMFWDYGNICSGDESADWANVVPTLYLDPTLSFNGVGDGSSGNPYQLLVN